MRKDRKESTDDMLRMMLILDEVADERERSLRRVLAGSRGEPEPTPNATPYDALSSTVLLLVDVCGVFCGESRNVERRKR